MPDLLGLGTWMTSLALAGVLGWAMGHRSNSVRGLVPDAEGVAVAANGVTDSADGKALALFTLMIEDPAPCEDTNAGNQPLVPALIADNRSAVFADMPPLAELEASTEAIRLSANVWDAPDLGERIAVLLNERDSKSRTDTGRYYPAIRPLALG